MIDSKTPQTYDKFRDPESGFHRAKCDRVFGSIKVDRNWKVLEIGCGTGIYTNFLKEHFSDVNAFDIDREMVGIANKKLGNKTNLFVADSLSIPVESKSIDFLFGVSILHHVADLSNAMEEVNRVLKPGGFLAFCEPNKLNPFTSIFQMLQKERAISRFEMKKQLSRNGLELVALNEILLRNPLIRESFTNNSIFSKVEKFFEKMHLGVTLLVVGRRTRQ
jgi:ubiquinone/menaquinone biosynthesis C-methylase UbiE